MKVRRRKKDFIDPEVQGAIARRMALHWGLYTVVAATLVLGVKWMTNPFTPIDQHLVEAWWTYGPMFVVLVCLAPVFVFDAVKLSNRFTGPVMRIRQATRSLAAGETPHKINLRDGDFWKELAGDFNRVIDRLDPSDEQRG